MLRRSLLPALLLGLLAPDALAQPAPPAAPTAPAASAPVAPAPVAPAPPLALPAPSPAQLAWLARYQAARTRFYAGDFGPASTELLALADSALEPSGALAARELGLMARDWNRRGLHLSSSSASAPRLALATDRSRRTSDEIATLYGYSILYGFGTGGMIAAHSEPDTAAGVILPSLGLAGASVGLVALLDRGPGMAYGVPQSIQSGLTFGLLQGITWSIWNQARSSYDEEWRTETVATVIWGSASVGAILGGALGSHFGTTPGRASFVSSVSLWSGLTTGLIAASLSGNENDQRDDTSLLVGALGLNAGAVAGILTASALSPTIARVRYLDLGAAGGGLIAGGLYLSAGDTDSSPRTAAGVTALGVAGGFGLAYLLTRSMPADRPEDDQRPAVETHASVTPVKGGLTLGLDGRW